MTTLLLKMFVKNYNDVKNPNVRKSYGFLGAFFGVFTNSILFISKLTIGLILMNASIIADGVNNLSDFGNCFITLIGFKISAKPADKEHPFGHQRSEYIMAMLVSVVILVLGLTVGIDGVKSIISPRPLEGNMIVPCVILGIGMLIKTLQSIVYFGLAKRINSLSLKASGVDARNDVITTGFVLAGYIIGYFTKFYYIDGILATIVAILIVLSGVSLLKDSVDILIGEKPDEGILKDFLAIFKKYPDILGIHDLSVHCYGPSSIFASIHVEFDGTKDIFEMHDLIDNIEKECFETVGVKTVIHMDPVAVGDPITNEYKEKVKEELAKISEELHFHDFRLVQGPSHINLVFDIVLPFGFALTKDEIIGTLDKALNVGRKKIYLVVEFDDEYTEIVKEEE
ncbi:MAG: cation transporter [Bacilli bacterium]|nr:cation transporter [Bacilli bacterium]